MADQDRKLEVDSLEVTELEDEDLERVSGGEPLNACPITNHCPIIRQPAGTGGTTI